MAVSWNMHWTAPATMVGSLLAGVLFALGHHLYYQSLAGQAIPTGNHTIAGFDVSGQQLNIALGTTMAFLTKASLAAAVSVAYIEIFWRALQTSNKGLQLSRIDAVFSILHNAFGFWKVHVWYKYPLLLSLAIISWYHLLNHSTLTGTDDEFRSIPIASIVTPATISVRNAAIQPPPSAMLGVPNLDFSSTNFVWPMPPGRRNDSQRLVGGSVFEGTMTMTEFCYAGPSVEVRKTASVVGMQGRVSQIDPPSSNSSWTTKFWGPAMTCQNASAAERSEIFYNYFQYLNQTMETCTESFSYLSWVPVNGSILPFEEKTTGNSSWTLREDDLSFGTGTSMFVAVIPRMFDNIYMPSHAISGACQATSDAWYSNVTWPELLSATFPIDSTQLFQCKFQNASYMAEFDYKNGAQSIRLDVLEMSNDIEPQDCVTGPSAATYGVGDSEKKYEEMVRANCSTLNTGEQRCEFDQTLLQTLSYQGVISAFVSLVRGTIGFDGFYAHIAYASNISTTSLMASSDLAFVRGWNASQFQDLPTAMSEQAGEKYIGLVNSIAPDSRGSLRSEMETMFQNITISLMSNSLLRPNYTSIYAPERLANVTLPAYHNVYIYNRSTLWIAYGLAIAFSAISVLLGLSVMLMNGASFDDSFSTILRVSKTAELMTEFKPQDEDGRLPLPAYLEKAKLVMPGQGLGRDGEKHVSISNFESIDSKCLGSESSASQLLRRDGANEVASAYREHS